MQIDYLTVNGMDRTEINREILKLDRERKEIEKKINTLVGMRKVMDRQIEMMEYNFDGSRLFDEFYGDL